MIKLVFTDMDGTLLHEDKTMPKESEDMFIKLYQKGVACGVASGRPLLSLQTLFPNFQQYATFIADNGAVIYHQGEILYKSILPLDWVREAVRATMDDTSNHPLLCTVKNAYALNRSRHHDRTLRNYYPEIIYVDDLLSVDEEIIKVTIYDDIDAKENTYPKLEHMLDRAKVTISAVEWTDITMPGIHKGFAVKKIQERLQITKDESMAFGDYYNDLELLENVKYSYAMENAVSQVKQVSNFMCPSNEEDGVLQVLKKVFQL
ncbi:MAG: HAD family hydrolase [Breznakia sp.]